MTFSYPRCGCLILRTQLGFHFRGKKCPKWTCPRKQVSRSGLVAPDPGQFALIMIILNVYSYLQLPNKYRVPSVAVFMVTDIFSIESSTGMVYRLPVNPAELLFFLLVLFEPVDTIVSPSNVPIVKLVTWSNSPALLNMMARPEVLLARSRKAGWRFLGSREL